MMRLSSVLLAVALASAAPAVGCTSQQSSVEAAVVAAVWVAPVAEDHPWVMAFMTSVSVARPEGIDARLEGRMDPDGREVMDPSILTPDKQRLVDYLRGYEQVHARPPNLAPVWELHPAPIETASPTWQLHFIDKDAGFRVDGATATVVQQGQTPVVELSFSPPQRSLFTDLTRAQLRRRIAFVIGDEVVSCPIVREPIDSGRVQLRDNSAGDPEIRASALLARLQQPG